MDGLRRSPILKAGMPGSGFKGLLPISLIGAPAILLNKQVDTLGDSRVGSTVEDETFRVHP